MQKFVYKLPPLLPPPPESAEPSRWYSFTKSIYSGVAQVLHPVWYFAQAILSIRDYFNGQAGQQQEVECRRQYCSKGKWEVLKGFVAHYSAYSNSTEDIVCLKMKLHQPYNTIYHFASMRGSEQPATCYFFLCMAISVSFSSFALAISSFVSFFVLFIWVVVWFLFT